MQASPAKSAFQHHVHTAPGTRKRAFSPRPAHENALCGHATHTKNHISTPFQAQKSTLPHNPNPRNPACSIPLFPRQKTSLRHLTKCPQTRFRAPKPHPYSPHTSYAPFASNTPRSANIPDTSEMPKTPSGHQLPNHREHANPRREPCAISSSPLPIICLPAFRRQTPNLSRLLRCPTKRHLGSNRVCDIESGILTRPARRDIITLW